MPKRSDTLVAGATGYIGKKLCLALAEKGAPPRAMARKPGRAQDLAAAGCEVVPGDVLRRETLAEPLEGIKVAYYLVHSMGRGGQGDYAERDREGAENFAAAAKDAGVKQIVYLGGLSDGGSKHLESRHETAEHLASTGIPVTYLRAAAVIGAGSESFRTLYYLTKNLPVMITPKWVNNKTQPIAIRDLIEILCQAPKIKDAKKGTQLDIGGPDVTTYGGMMDSMAKAMGVRKRLKVPVPVLSPGLSSHWVGFVTPVDAGVARELVQGLSQETIVKDPEDMRLFELDLTSMDRAMEQAIAEGGESLS